MGILDREDLAFWQDVAQRWNVVVAESKSSGYQPTDTKKYGYQAGCKLSIDELNNFF
ncbi:hypothetical protein ACQRAB_11150 [Megasphaera elsdenii]|uniref:hypothetical protein n=1 Tax=Megasphaera elsdenii TaxID=907 RepID=UPI003D02E854